MHDLSTAPEAPGTREGSAPPLLSIIIPVYNLGAYIDSCLDSITGQKFDDIEIIAVDGKSTDNTCELLLKKRLDEPRLTLYDAAEPGPGQARNIGARAARGEYLWFVDGDDELTPGGLAAIAARLRSERPDVLLVNYRMLEPAGLTDGQDDKLLAAEQGGLGALADRPWLIGVSMVSWNKIVRREFYHASGAEFLRTWPHEDVPVSCRLLLRAGRISVLHQVCYQFLKERPESATKAGDPRRHFAVFGAWQQILADARKQALAGAPDMPVSVYHWLFQRAVQHCSTVLDARPELSDPYIADGDRRAFFAELAELYATYKLRGYRPPRGFRGFKFRLIAARQYRIFALLDPVNTRRVSVTTKARALLAHGVRARRGSASGRG